MFIRVPEMFVHVAGQNFTWFSYTELKITTTDLDIQQLLIFSPAENSNRGQYTH